MTAEELLEDQRSRAAAKISRQQRLAREKVEGPGPSLEERIALGRAQEAWEALIRSPEFMKRPNTAWVLDFKVFVRECGCPDKPGQRRVLRPDRYKFTAVQTMWEDSK